MKTLSDVERWCHTAAERFGDPSLVTCQLFLRHISHHGQHDGDDLVFAVDRGELFLKLDPGEWFPLSISPTGPESDLAGELVAFGLEQIESGLWVLLPSLNVPGLIHAFITLYDVPDPAPWTKLIVLAS